MNTLERSAAALMKMVARIDRADQKTDCWVCTICERECRTQRCRCGGATVRALRVMTCPSCSVAPQAQTFRSYERPSRLVVAQHCPYCRAVDGSRMQLEARYRRPGLPLEPLEEVTR